MHTLFCLPPPLYPKVYHENVADKLIHSKTAWLYKKVAAPFKNGQCEKVVKSKGEAKKWL